MGVILLGVLLAAAGVAPADGHTVVPLAKARFDSELRCEGPLEGSFLAPANARGGLGVRAPIAAGKVACRLHFAKGPDFPFALTFTPPPGGLAVGPAAPVFLGQDKEAVLKVSGRPVRADGSAGPVQLAEGTVSAALPASKMPQNLVVLVQDEKGAAAYAVVSLLGRATVKVQTAREASVEAVVAGHRSTGFTSDAAGQAAVAVPAPPGFVKGVIDVGGGGKRSTRAPIGLPLAKPLFALAAIGPGAPVAPGTIAEVVVAGANPLGLPPKPRELKATAAGAAKLLAVTPQQPGLWRVRLRAGAAGEATVQLGLGTASRTVTFQVGAPAPKAPAPPPVAQTPPVAAEPAPAPASTPPPAETPPLPPPQKAEVLARTDQVRAAEPPRPAAATVVREPAATPRDEGSARGFRLELLAEGGYLTNGGALAGLAPGVQAQLAYRLGDIDVGGGFDLLYAFADKHNQLQTGGGTIDATTRVQSLQLLVGPWLRYRITERVGVDVAAGLGLSRTSEQIESGGQTASFGPASPLALGGLGGLDLDFGGLRAFAGVRVVSASASGTLQGNAGGVAALAGLGVDLGL